MCLHLFQFNLCSYYFLEKWIKVTTSTRDNCPNLINHKSFIYFYIQVYLCSISLSFCIFAYIYLMEFSIRNWRNEFSLMLISISETNIFCVSSYFKRIEMNDLIKKTKIHVSTNLSQISKIPLTANRLQKSFVYTIFIS